MDDLSGLRVLLVEDDPASAELTADVLGEALPTPSVTTVRTLREAVAAATEDAVDLAVVDLGLPDAEGLEPVVALRDAAGPGTAVVVLTGRQADDLAERALRSGAQDYLVKSDLRVPEVRRSVRYAVLRSRAEASVHGTLQWAQSVLDSIESAVCALDADGVVVAVNRAWERACVESGGDLRRSGIGVSYLEVCRRAAEQGDVVAGQVELGLRNVLRGWQKRFQTEYSCDSPDKQRWFSLRAVPSAGRHGVVVTHVDITSLRQAQHELGHLATHDPLTGLGNRRLLLDELEHRLDTATPDRVVAVLFADLDHFKRINDTHGHAAGDGVLVEVADSVRSAVRADDVVVRHGGDEFVVLATVSGEQEALALADRVQAAMCRPVLVDDRRVPLTASQGLVVVGAGSGTGTDEVLAAADAAMYEAKDHGRARVAVYSDELRERARDQARLLGELEHALDAGELELHYQPIVVPDAGGVHAVEALLRWRHPRLGLLSPAAFLPLAEASGLIVPIGSWALGTACAQGRRLHDEGLLVAVTVNLSAKQLGDSRVVDDVRTALETTRFRPASLVIEVTETTMIEDHEGSVETLRRLKALGVQIAVDDFGTGYSSLSYLRRYPVDGLKVDRSFVRDLPDNGDDQAIVSSVLTLARELDLWVVAEGVEDDRQLRALLDLGCELAQGFLYARATPPDELAGVLRGLSDRRAVRPPARVPSQRRRRRAAEVVAPAVLEQMRSMQADGASLHTIAAALNARGETTAGGLRWHPRSVARVLAVAAEPAHAGSAS